ncbi:DedA family protein [Terrilactibacillus sp. S3-3]|nr:DedA family protein [Terrilactibacillus sp. S3-3]
MSYVGILSFQGKMNLVLAILSAGTGGIIGATISYWIGYKLGVPFFHKYGHYIHMGPEKMEKVSKWYEKYGKVLLIFSFFVPGIRHIASIISGVISLPFRSFCIFAYIGVFLWVGAFTSLGYILGPEWDKYQGEIKKWLVLASLLIALGVICYFVIKTNKNYIKQSLLLLFQSVFKKYKSFLRIKFFILLIFIVFVSLFTLMVGMVQDFIGNDFEQFNAISRIIVFTLFSGQWQPFMHNFYLFSSWPVLEGIFLYTIVIIFYNNTNKWLELLFYLLTLTGNVLFAKGIRWLFHFMLSGKNISMDFPNETAMILIAFYGFFYSSCWFASSKLFFF